MKTLSEHSDRQDIPSYSTEGMPYGYSSELSGKDIPPENPLIGPIPPENSLGSGMTSVDL